MVNKINIKDILLKLDIKTIKPKQKEIINLFLKKEKQDTIAILPTGYGKSLCYIVPFLLKNKNVIVISPLISLMDDQANKLREKNINTLIFNSNNKPFSGTEGQIEYSNILKGEKSHIIYFSPESFIKNEFYIRSLIEYDRISMIAIDECHCVCTWSDFRKDYNNMHVIKEWIDKYKKHIYVLALTATATQPMIVEIIKKLNFKNPIIIKENMYKDNLKIKIYDKSTNVHTDILKIKKFLDNLIDKSKAIIYCKSRKDTETISNELNKKFGIKCTYYHAGLDAESRINVQTKYRDCELNVIVATIAFGMGIDDKNIHLIIHYGISDNIESYYQEVGRGGRNGGMVDCYVFWSKRDFVISNYHIKNSDMNIIAKNAERDKLNDLEKFIKSIQCRMQFICNYFGDKVDICSKCDNCLRGNNNILKTLNIHDNTSDKTSDNDNIIICNYIIIDTIVKLDTGIGMKSLSLLLRGSKSKKITPKMRLLDTYGKLENYNEDFIKKKVENLQNNGLINEHNVKSGWGSYFKINSSGNDWYNNNKKRICKSLLVLERFVKIIKFRVMLNKLLKKKIINKSSSQNSSPKQPPNSQNSSCNSSPKQPQNSSPKQLPNSSPKQPPKQPVNSSKLYNKSMNELKEKILVWRKNMSVKMNLPQYCILKNNVVEQLIIKNPKTKIDLENIKGVGKIIIEKYGNDILSFFK